MFVKIHGTKEYVKGNKESCSDLVNYLAKENEGKDFVDKEYFFNQNGTNFNDLHVQHTIDNNVKGLHKKDAKFYMLTINPSQQELQHLAKSATDISSPADRKVESIKDLNPEELKRYNGLLKDYVNNVMEVYAANFNRGLTANDIVYFAKIEQERHYSYKDEELSKKVQELKETQHLSIKSTQKTLSDERVKQFIKYLTNQKDDKELSEMGKELSDEGSESPQKEELSKKVKELCEKVRDMKENKKMNLKTILKDKEMVEENKKSVIFFYNNSVINDSVKELLGNEKNKDVANYFENGIVNEGDLKEGFQTHIHVVVSRMDKNMETSLSPLANHKDSKNILNEKEVQIGFDRNGFKQTSETLFDEQFRYKREYNQYYQFSKSSYTPVQLSANQIQQMPSHLSNSTHIKGHQQKDLGERESMKAYALAQSVARNDPENLVKNVLKMGEYDSMDKGDLGRMNQGQFLKFAASIAKGNPVSIAKDTLKILKDAISIEI